MAAVPDLDDWNEGTEINMSTIRDCICPLCGEGKATTLCLPTKVPYFREIIVMTLNCPDCGLKNTEVSFGGELQRQGVKVELEVERKDLDRQVIKSDSCTIKLPSLELEIPPQTQRGQVTTIEGVLKKTADGLEEGQAQRAMDNLDVFRKIQSIIVSLRKMAGDVDSDDDSDGETKEDVFPFSLILDDPAGNSYLENPLAPEVDPKMTTTRYNRTPNQDMAIGLQPSKQAIEEGMINDSDPSHKNHNNSAAISDSDLSKLGREEVMSFPTPCPGCGASGETNMCVANIPHFKEIIIMSLDCAKCGYRSNEIKGGGAIPKFGTKVELRVEDEEDMGREVLKSDTGGIMIPEIEMELEEGGMDGVYSTVEGLVKKLHERIEMANPFGGGDSGKKNHKGNDGGDFNSGGMGEKWQEFLGRLADCRDGKSFPFTVVISDPLSNSFIGPRPSVAATMAFESTSNQSDLPPPPPDPQLKVTEYTRSADQNEILGISDMKTEGYNMDGGRQAVNHGTDEMANLPDRIANKHERGPDHPNVFGKPTVEGDETGWGEDSVVVRTESTRRGEEEKEEEEGGEVWEREMGDEEFQESGWKGQMEGMVFKKGAKGVGYYKDV
ncbi:hypothetical protein TrCOL_g12019 [Triparma columacea]|uniref:Zinc finger ZPR1-type domain-containing protein n=1 Tax=Triparma columacea TaxID=722753 RepID=A0A9W7GIZ8_9STRA|nr:hypothetical protein TrCOL_g12019 [Triparma columacea]